MGVTTGTSFLGSGGLRGGISPTQQAVQAFLGTGLLDALLVFDPDRYSPSTGVLVDALGGPISYTPTGATPVSAPPAILSPSGYWYADFDGVNNTLIAGATQVVPWYIGVFRSPPGKPTWSNYGGVLEDASAGTTADLQGMFDGSGVTTYFDIGPQNVQRDGVDVTDTLDLAPITEWMLVCVSTAYPAESMFLQLAGVYGQDVADYRLALQLAAVGVRYTMPDDTERGAIADILSPMQQGLLSVP